MGNFNVARKKHILMPGYEVEVSGTFTLSQPLFKELGWVAQEIIGKLNPVELRDIKGREPRELLLIPSGDIIPNDSSANTYHELYYCSGRQKNPQDNTLVEKTCSVESVFSGFTQSSILHSLRANGAPSVKEALQCEIETTTVMRFGLEFFGASFFNAFYNFAPSIVATIHIEASHNQLALKIWREGKRRVYEQDLYNFTISSVTNFCSMHVGASLPEIE